MQTQNRISRRSRQGGGGRRRRARRHQARDRDAAARAVRAHPRPHGPGHPRGVRGRQGDGRQGAGRAGGAGGPAGRARGQTGPDHRIRSDGRRPGGKIPVDNSNRTLARNRGFGTLLMVGSDLPVAIYRGPAGPLRRGTPSRRPRVGAVWPSFPRADHESANNPIDLLEEFVSANDWRFDRTTDAEMRGRAAGQLVRLSALLRLAGGSGRHLFLLPVRRAHAPEQAGRRLSPAGADQREALARPFRPLLGGAGADVSPYAPAARHWAGSRPSSSRIWSISPSANASASSRPFSSCSGAVRRRKRHWQRPCWRPSARPEVS